MAEKVDPIRKRYYSQLETAEAWANRLFYLTAALSLAVLIGPLKEWPPLYSTLQIGFLALTIVGFVLGQMIRLYFMPRAEKKRREDLVSDGLGVALTHERTSGYYNNEETEPFRRLGMDVLENTFHSKDTALEMCKWERVRIGIYALLWFLLIVNRTIAIDWIIVAAQALFSEQLIARWLRLEWLRIEVEKLYDALLRVFQSVHAPEMLRALVIEDLTGYEAAKARAGVTLSAKIFTRRNRELSEEWKKVKQTIPKQNNQAGGQ